MDCFAETSDADLKFFAKKQIKKWRIEKKLELIAGTNTDWDDPAESRLEEQIPCVARFGNELEKVPHSAWYDNTRGQPQCAWNDQLYPWIDRILSL